VDTIPLWAQIVIAIVGSGTVGAIAGAIAASYAARQKIKELEVVYQQRLEENYRANIISHIQTLYIPINIALSKLVNEYNKYRWGNPTNRHQFAAEFRLACEKFVAQMLDIYDQGMDVYLTSELDLELRRLTFFIRNSLNCPEQLGILNLIKYIYANHLSRQRKEAFNRYAPLISEAFIRYLDGQGSKVKLHIRNATLGIVSPT
jgi:hypothetical protein